MSKIFSDGSPFAFSLVLLTGRGKKHDVRVDFAVVLR